MIEQTIMEYLVNALWQVPLLAGVGWLLVRLLRPGPQMQHRVWLTVLGLAVLLPVCRMDRTNLSMAAPHRAIAQQDASREQFPDSDLPPPRKHWFEIHPQVHTMRLTPTVTHWVVRLYLATIALGLFRIARGWMAARHLVDVSRETHQHDAALNHYARRLGVKRPRLRESAEVSSPMILGVATPVLLLPEDFVRFTEDEIEAVLCHELAHVKRRDYLMNFVCQVAALPLAWHPVVYEIQQRIRLTREMVCDAMAAQEMQSQVGYARCLLALAHSMLGVHPTPRHAQYPGLFTNNTMEKRVMRLMETTTVSARAKVVRAASGAMVTIASVSLAALFHVTPTWANAIDEPAQVAQATPAAAQTLPVVPLPRLTSSAVIARQPQSVRVMPFIHPHADNRKYIMLAQLEPETIDDNCREQIKDAQRQMAEAHSMLDSPEFKQQMEDAKRQMAEATAKLSSPEFKQQMEDSQREMLKARAMLDSPEFKRQMEDLSKKFQSDEFRRGLERDIQRSMEAPAQTENKP